MKKIQTTIFGQRAITHGPQGYDQVCELQPFLFETDKCSKRYVTGFNNKIHQQFHENLIEFGNVLTQLAEGYYNKKALPIDKKERASIKMMAPCFTQGLMRCTEFGGTEDTIPHRTIANIQYAIILAVDIDNKNKSHSQNEILSILNKTGYEYLLYPSFSSKKDDFRCRVIFTLKTPVSCNTKFRSLYLNFTNTVFGEGVADLAVSNLNSLLFVSSGYQMRKRIYVDGKSIKPSNFINENGELT